MAHASRLEFLYYDLDVRHNIVVVWGILDRVKAGVFQAIFIAPPVSSWVLPHHEGSSQSQLRNRAQPLGLSSLSIQDQGRLRDANYTMEICTWIAAQSFAARIPCLLTFPEYVGGHVSSGPASPWSLQQVSSQTSRPLEMTCSKGGQSLPHCSNSLFTTALSRTTVIVLPMVLLRLPSRRSGKFSLVLCLLFPLACGDVSSPLWLGVSCPRPLGTGRFSLRGSLILTFLRPLVSLFLPARGMGSITCGAVVLLQRSPWPVSRSMRTSTCTWRLLWLVLPVPRGAPSFSTTWCPCLLSLWVLTSVGRLLLLSLVRLRVSGWFPPVLGRVPGRVSPSRAPLVGASASPSSWAGTSSASCSSPSSSVPGSSELLSRHPQKSRRTSELQMVRGELEGQESPTTGRQVQQFRATVPILPPPAAVQNSEGQSHELQMGGPGPRGPHQATAAVVLSPGRSELLPTDTTAPGYATTFSSTRPRSSRSTKAPLGPKDQRGPDGDGASSLLGGVAQQGDTKFGFKCFHFKGTGCLLSSGQRFREDPGGSLQAHSRSVLGELYADTPIVVPTRAWLDEVRKFMRGDYYIGRGTAQRGLAQS